MIKRQIQVSIRMTPKEKQELEILALAHRMDTSNFIRTHLQEKYIRFIKLNNWEHIEESEIEKRVFENI